MFDTNIYPSVRAKIQDGDIALMRNGGIIGLISGPYTHAAMCKWMRDATGKPTTLMLCESREFYGGRIVTLSSQIRQYPGRIDLYRPRCTREVADIAAELVARQAGHRYGWKDIGRAAQKRIPIANWFMLPDRVSMWYEPKDCSHTVCWALKAAAAANRNAYDPTPTISPRDCEPRHLANRRTMDLLCIGLVHK